MITKLGITPKLTLIFILFAGAVLAGLGIPAYNNGRTALEGATVSELLTTALEKQAALASWVADRQHSIGDIANQAHLREAVTALMAAAPGSSDAGLAHADLVADLENWAGEGHRFLSMEVIDAATGRVIAATDAIEEGKFREEQPYFINGLQAAYVQNPYYDLARQRPGMTAAAPVRSSDGRVIAVLAGPLNMDEMNAIIQRRSGLHQTDDAFLVNTSNLFVTQPRLNPDPAVLQRGIHTEAVNRCLAHNSGVVAAPDYRNVPAFIVYRWLPERQLCLITKMDQNEALAPARALASTMALTGGLVFLIGSIVAFGMSSTIARPVRQLVQGAEQIGLGNLDYRIEVKSGDEIGKLGTAFNKMAAAIGENETQLRKWATDLELRVQERTIELRASEERYRILSETSPDMIFVIDRQDNVQYVNNLAARQFGKTPELVIGKARTELFPPGIAEGQALGLQQVLKSAQPFSSESSIVFPGGQLWLDTQLVPLRNEAGEVSAVMGVSRDITERKLVEETLHQSEEKYRHLFQNAQVGMYRSKLDGSAILAVNQKLCEIFGFSEEEMIENPATLRWANPAARNQMVAELRRTGSLRDYEMSILTKNGVVRTCLISISLNSELGYLEGSAIDITERKRAELALQDSEERFRSAFEQAAVGISHVALDGRFLRVNQRYCEILGYSQEEMLGLTLQKITHPDDLKADLNHLNALLAGQTKTYSMEKRNIRKDHSLVWVNRTVGLVREPTGEPKYLVAVVEDISERKLAQEELKKSAAELARSNAELERFAYVASHDLQEPLRMVTSYLQLLELRYKDRLDGAAIEFIDYAVDGAARMKTLINDLLAFSRVSSRGETFTRTNCETVLERVLADLRLAIGESGARVTHDPLPTLQADAAQMESVFLNLIGNAIKFHGSQPPAIHIGAQRQPGEWLFSVGDNGIGIDPKYFERIFLIFQRLHTRDKYPGTGIGLAISQRIIERHGGRIWVESQPGQGSVFYFTLPIRGDDEHDKPT